MWKDKLLRQVFLALLVLLAGLVLVGAQAGWAADPVSGPQPGLQPQPLLVQDYRSVELSFKNGEVPLAGSLVLPEGAGPFPAVVMLHGSEPDERAIFWRTGDAEAFLKAGIAVFIYDKRGVGASGGNWRTAGLDDLAADGAAAVELVRARPEVFPNRVGVFGVSQGGTLAPMVALRSGNVAFVINVSGSGLPLANQELWSAGNELRRRSFSPAAVADTMQVMHLAFSARPLLRSGLLPLGDLYLWFVNIDPYQDPAALWRQVAAPMYVAYGAQDNVMPARESAAVAQAVFAERHNPFDRLVVVPGAGHGVRLSSGQWAPGHIEQMTGWVLAVTQGHAPEQATVVQAVDPGENRWFGLGARPTPWYATFTVQVGLILFFAMSFGLGLLLALNPRVTLALPGVGRLPRMALLTGSAVNLLLLAGLLVVLGFLAFADPNGAGPQVAYAGLLSALSGVSAVLAAVLAYFSARGRRSAAWSRAVRTVYTLAAAASVGYLIFLLYWRLLGPPL